MKKSAVESNTTLKPPPTAKASFHRRHGLPKSLGAQIGAHHLKTHATLPSQHPGSNHHLGNEVLNTFLVAAPLAANTASFWNWLEAVLTSTACISRA